MLIKNINDKTFLLLKFYKVNIYNILKSFKFSIELKICPLNLLFDNFLILNYLIL